MLPNDEEVDLFDFYLFIKAISDYEKYKKEEELGEEFDEQIENKINDQEFEAKEDAVMKEDALLVKQIQDGMIGSKYTFLDDLDYFEDFDDIEDLVIIEDKDPITKN
ncbi:hypothetical protein E3N88_09757 [Mikania micrantha]|uniref:Uncharacterized protein n=1 Tax=Mikania micrantha TaxID=192012 RepID=A0A5N6PLZ7_9ASTR|nr:hypothetical protein E3N88_09757 [Mikania micrantha]